LEAAQVTRGWVEPRPPPSFHRTLMSISNTLRARIPFVAEEDDALPVEPLGEEGERMFQTLETG
jgi:hypothetical protein